MNLEKINVGGNEYDICDAKTRAMVSDEYDPEGDYVAGDLCIHDNKLHEAKGPTTGAWDSTKWEGRTLAEVLKSQNSNLESLKSSSIAAADTLFGTINQLSPGSIGQVEIDFQPVSGTTKYLIIPLYATWGCVVDCSRSENTITTSVVNIGTAMRNINVAVMVIQLGKS